MNNKVNLEIVSIVGSTVCVTSEDGQLFYKQLSSFLRSGCKVVISFHGVESLTSIFLNAAIGQLYSEFDEAYVRENMSLSNITPDDAILLKRVVDNAKQYFRDPVRFEKIKQEAMGYDDED